MSAVPPFCATNISLLNIEAGQEFEIFITSCTK